MVDHDLGDVVLGEELLEGPETQGLVEDVGLQALDGDALGDLLVELHLGDDVVDAPLGPRPELLVAELVDVEAPEVHVLDEAVVDLPEQPVVALDLGVDPVQLGLPRRRRQRGGHALAVLVLIRLRWRGGLGGSGRGPGAVGAGLAAPGPAPGATGGDGGAIGVDVDDVVADVDLVGPPDDLGRADLLAVDEGPVGRLQVEDDELPVLEDDLGVLLGDVALRQHQIVAGDPADGDGVLLEGAVFRLPALLTDDQVQTHAMTSGSGESTPGSKVATRGALAANGKDFAGQSTSAPKRESGPRPAGDRPHPPGHVSRRC